MTFRPPDEMSVMVQSRGNEPVPNWILAKLRHTRRSLWRRFANILILTPPALQITWQLVWQFVGFTEELLEFA